MSPTSTLTTPPVFLLPMVGLPLEDLMKTLLQVCTNGREFFVAEANSYLPDRITVDEDELAISEWNVPISDMEIFLNRLKNNK